MELVYCKHVCLALEHFSDVVVFAIWHEEVQIDEWFFFFGVFFIRLVSDFLLVLLCKVRRLLRVSVRIEMIRVLRGSIGQSGT